MIYKLLPDGTLPKHDRIPPADWYKKRKGRPPTKALGENYRNIKLPVDDTTWFAIKAVAKGRHLGIGQYLMTLVIKDLPTLPPAGQFSQTP